MKVIKYVFGVLIILASFGGFFESKFVIGFAFLILGIILLPPISEKLKERLSIWNNKAVRYISYAILLVIAGSMVDKNEINESNDEVKQKVTNNSKNNANSNVKLEVQQDVNWTNVFSQKDILGNWLQEKYYHKDNMTNITEVKNGSAEQKLLILTSSKYQTAFPYGAGKNPAFSYTLNSNYLSVVTGKLKSEIYGFKVYINDDKTKLLLKENTGLFQVFTKKK